MKAFQPESTEHNVSQEINQQVKSKRADTGKSHPQIMATMQKLGKHATQPKVTFRTLGEGALNVGAVGNIVRLTTCNAILRVT